MTYVTYGAKSYKNLKVQGFGTVEMLWISSFTYQDPHGASFGHLEILNIKRRWVSKPLFGPKTWWLLNSWCCFHTNQVFRAEFSNHQTGNIQRIKSQKMKHSTFDTLGKSLFELKICCHKWLYFAGKFSVSEYAQNKTKHFQFAIDFWVNSL